MVLMPYDAITFTVYKFYLMIAVKLNQYSKVTLD